MIFGPWRAIDVSLTSGFFGAWCSGVRGHCPGTGNGKNDRLVENQVIFWEEVKLKDELGENERETKYHRYNRYTFMNEKREKSKDRLLLGTTVDLATESYFPLLSTEARGRDHESI
jgi:hypothetical protein